MILVDANLLIYAVNRDAPLHRAARHWLESALSGTDTVGLAWIVVLALIRITTRPGLLARPLDTEQAINYIEQRLDLPTTALASPGDSHWAILTGQFYTPCC